MVIISPMFHNQSNISGITFLTLDQCFVAGSSHGSVDHPVRTGGTKPIFSIYRRSFHRLRQACDFWPVAVAVSCCRDDCRWGTEVTKGFLGPWKLKKTYPESPKSSWMVKKYTQIYYDIFLRFFRWWVGPKKTSRYPVPKNPAVHHHFRTSQRGHLRLRGESSWEKQSSEMCRTALFPMIN